MVNQTFSVDGAFVSSSWRLPDFTGDGFILFPPSSTQPSSQSSLEPSSSHTLTLPSDVKIPTTNTPEVNVQVIAGAISGGVGFLGVILLLAIIWCRHRCRRQSHPQLESIDDPEAAMIPGATMISPWIDTGADRAARSSSSMPARSSSVDTVDPGEPTPTPPRGKGSNSETTKRLLGASKVQRVDMKPRQPTSPFNPPGLDQTPPPSRSARSPDTTTPQSDPRQFPHELECVAAIQTSQRFYDNVQRQTNNPDDTTISFSPPPAYQEYSRVD